MHMTSYEVQFCENFNLSSYHDWLSPQQPTINFDETKQSYTGAQILPHQVENVLTLFYKGDKLAPPRQFFVPLQKRLAIGC